MLRDHCILLGKWVVVGRVSTDVPRGNKGVTKLLAIRSRPETDGIHPWTLDIFLGTRLSSLGFENSCMQTVSGERIIGLSLHCCGGRVVKEIANVWEIFSRMDSVMGWIEIIQKGWDIGYLRIDGIFARKIVFSKELRGNGEDENNKFQYHLFAFEENYISGTK